MAGPGPEWTPERGKPPKSAVTLVAVQRGACVICQGAGLHLDLVQLDSTGVTGYVCTLCQRGCA